MKIAIITEFFSRDKQAFTGGVEARTYHWIKHLEQDHQVVVIAKSRNFVAANAESILPRIRFMVSAWWQTLRLQPDIIEGSNLICYLPAYMSGLFLRKPVIAWIPDIYDKDWFRDFSGLTAWSGYLLERLILKLPYSQIIAMSQVTKKKLEKAGVRPERITVVYGGVDVTKLEKIKTNKSKNPSIVTMARLVNYKRVDDLIKAVAELKAKHPKLTLDILGDGPERGRLETLAQDLGVSKQVKFHGALEQEQAFKILKQSHIFSLPSIVEGFGLVTVEAAAAQVPFVSSDIAPTREITEGGLGGILYLPKSIDKLVKGIDSLLTNQKLYKDKQSQAKRLARKYDWSEIHRQTYKVYQLVTNPKNK